MTTEDTVLLTKYISSWGYHILSVIFLTSSFITLLLNSIPSAIAFIIIFIICEYLAFRRQLEIYNGKGKTRGRKNKTSVDNK